MTSVVGDFCDQAERYFRGEGLPPLPVRLWWAYRHWRFQRANKMTAPNDDRWKQRGPKLDAMTFSEIAGRHYKVGGIIPLAPGQNVEFIPVDNGYDVEAVETNTGERRKLHISNRALRHMCRPHFDGPFPPPGLNKLVLYNTREGEFQINSDDLREATRGALNFNGLPIVPAQRPASPNSIGEFPRPDCPKCGTSHPELGTPLDNGNPSGWGNSYFTCTNWKCRHTWLFRKIYPDVVENNNKQGTVTGTLLKGTNIPFYLFGLSGCTVEQVNKAIKTFANVAGLKDMSPSQQLRMNEVIAGQEKQSSLPKLTSESGSHWDHRQDIWKSNGGR